MTQPTPVQTRLNGRRKRSARSMEERLAALEEEVQHLRAQLRTEVRTRRLVVEEEDGFERIVGEGSGEWGTLKVRHRSGEASARMTAGEADGYEHAEVAVNGGDVWGMLRIQRSTEPHEERDLLDRRYEVEMSIDQPNSAAGMVLTSDGVALHPMRKYYEDKAREEDEKRTRQAWKDNGVTPK